MAVSPFCLLVLDQVISALLIGPLVVFFWRGTWTLLDSAGLDPRYSMIIGQVGFISASFLQDILKKYISQNNSISWLIGSRVYMYIMGVVSINFWRGTWETIDMYAGMSPESHGVSLAIGYGLLLLLRSSRNTQAPPTLVENDINHEQCFLGTTRFRTDHRLDKENYILDTFFTYLGVHTLMVNTWRGIWGLMDIYIYPDDYVTTTWVGLSIAYGLFVLLFPLQILCNHLYKKAAARKDRRGWWGKVLSQQLLNTVATVCSVSTWRGVWYTLDLFLWPDNLTGSAAITHCVGIAVLLMMMTGTSVIEKGCMLDGEGDEAGGCYLQNHYLRNLFRRKAEQLSKPDLGVATGNIIADKRDGYTNDMFHEETDS